jgi:hypothetical protein
VSRWKPLEGIRNENPRHHHGALVALTIPAQADWTNPWDESNREWECSFHKETPATADRDPVYKTELYVMYDQTSNRQVMPVVAFNVRHTTRSGEQYERDDQYTNLHVGWQIAANRKSGSQTWTGDSVRYPNLRIIGQLKWTNNAKGLLGTYSEYFYRNGVLANTVTAQCH